MRQFFSRELINADGMTEFENHHFTIPGEVMDLSSNH